MPPDGEITVSDIDRAPVDLPPGADTNFKNEYAKLLERFTPLSEKVVAQAEELGKLRAKETTRKLLDDLIKPSALGAFIFMCCYSVIVSVMLFLHGFKDWGFQLPEEVMKYLVGSTAVTVIGLVGMVLTGVFVGARKSE